MKNVGSYYLTLFTLEGHMAWRTHLSQKKESFDHEAKVNNFPKITDRKTFVIDRLTGTLTPLV